ncbi:TonB-dependent siderophore receptor [Brevundimonas sp.]|uniref:TonB-dependent receptor n=1 Tax=Brevundimonas sp. TaxID=1871086 RepID=UPI001A1B438A|nr:TonB-dependent siderophore receptor [Brevundimonas sp.]MBJ7485101.1 TonB-dependent siderophore receptor [Brevundimonas sp.]
MSTSPSRPTAVSTLAFAMLGGVVLSAGSVQAEVRAPDSATMEAPTSTTADIDLQQATELDAVDVNGRRLRREPTSPEFVAPLLDTPRSVTVISQQVIEQIGATSLQDLLRTSPGITFGAGEGGQPLADRPFIRGQASGNNFFVDGIRDTGGQQREVFNLEQVEIIKGPDSVYSGRGSGGGSINLSSKAPHLTDFTNVSLGGGTDNYFRGTIDQNWQIGETAALRLNVLSASADIAGRDSVDYEKLGVAAALAVGLDTDTLATLSLYYLDADQMPDYGIPLFTKIGVRTTETGILDVPYDSFYGLEARDYLNNETRSATFEVEHRLLPNLTLRNVTRYSETLNDYVVTNPGDGGNITTVPSATAGVRLINGEYWMKRGLKSRWNPTTTLANVTELFGTAQTGSLKHSFDLGLELTSETNENASYTVTTLSGSACPAPLIGFDCTRVYNPDPKDPWTGTIVRGVVSDSTTQTLGLFAFDSIEIGDKWLLNLGVRYDEYSAEGTNATGTPTAPVYTPAPRGDWDFVNYQVGLVYKPTSNSSVYASWATSSTPPTISGGDQNAAGTAVNVLLDPEESTSFEIGAKAALFREQLQLSAALFQTSRENAVVLVDVGISAQVGEVEVRGLEIGISGNITPQWQVFGGYTYQQSELVRGAYNNINTGDSLANTPEHNVSLFSTYRVTSKLTAGGGVYYVGESFGGNQGGAGGGANRIYAPDYTRVDLFASYDLTDRATLQLNVQNATDEEYILRTNGVHHADPAPARSATLALNMRF